MNKTAIVILSDPKAGSEEALGRIFNALAAVYDFQQAGEEVKLLFQGTGTRWPEELEKEEHPAHQLYKTIAASIEGASTGCADVFGAKPLGLDLIADNHVPGTTGLPSFVKLQKEGFQIITF